MRRIITRRSRELRVPTDAPLALTADRDAIVWRRATEILAAVCVGLLIIAGTVTQ